MIEEYAKCNFELFDEANYFNFLERELRTIIRIKERA
jgi:hypothetical protein